MRRLNSSLVSKVTHRFLPHSYKEPDLQAAVLEDATRPLMLSLSVSSSPFFGTHCLRPSHPVSWHLAAPLSKLLSRRLIRGEVTTRGLGNQKGRFAAVRGLSQSCVFRRPSVRHRPLCVAGCHPYWCQKVCQAHARSRLIKATNFSYIVNRQLTGSTRETMPRFLDRVLCVVLPPAC
jgi:hypothetical protein